MEEADNRILDDSILSSDDSDIIVKRLDFDGPTAKHDPRALHKTLTSHRDLSKVFSLLKETNSTFSEVIKMVSCYRAHLGLTLEGVFATYNRIITLTIENTNKILAKREENIQTLYKTHSGDLQLEQKRYTRLKDKLAKKKKSIFALKTQLRASKICEKSLQGDLLDVREMVKPVADPVFDKNVGSKYLEHVVKICQDAKLDTQLESLQSLMSDMESEHSHKTEIVHVMNSLVDRILHPNRGHDKACQVRDEELYWFIDPRKVDPLPTDPKCYFSITKQAERVDAMTRPDAIDEDKWALTPFLMRFLSNTPNRLTLPWTYGQFKGILNDICSERLKYTSEVVGFMHPPLPLDEFLCVYFVKKHQLRRLAELKLKEFLGSLRFYISRWPRARLFAQVSGISGDLLVNEDFVYNEYQTQMYFLYCIHTLTHDIGSYWEDTEGHTWLRNDREDFYASILMPWVKKNEYRKTKIEMGYLSKGLTDNKGQYGIFYDVDLLLGFFVKGFVDARQRSTNRLYKKFIKKSQVQLGLFSFDEFKGLVDIPPKKKGFNFPGDYTIARALCFSLCSEQNGFEIDSMSFASACIRYGITNPAPIAQMSIEDVFPYTSLKRVFDKTDERFTAIMSKVKFNREEVNTKGNLKTFKEPHKETISTSVVPSIEKVAALLAQHYSIIREVQKYAVQFKDLVEVKADTEEVLSAFEALSIVLHNASEFFSFPLTF